MKVHVPSSLHFKKNSVDPKIHLTILYNDTGQRKSEYEGTEFLKLIQNLKCPTLVSGSAYNLLMLANEDTVYKEGMDCIH